MPLYPFACQTCGHAEDEYRKIGNFAPVEVCPKCGKLTYLKEVSLCGTDLKQFHTPIEMHSIGCTSVEQIREMQRAGVEISDDPNDELYGTPIARCRADKLRALKVAGFVETN